MFANKITYTQSPGGIRRGLIWQSSETRPARKEQRNFFISPYTYTYGDFTELIGQENVKSIVFPSGAYTNENNEIVRVQGFRPDLLNAQPVSSIVFPYATTVKTDPLTGQDYLAILASALVTTYDIDCYIYPSVYKDTSFYHKSYGELYPGYEAPIEYYYKGRQLNKHGTISANYYFEKTPGNIDSNSEELQKPRMITPSLPMRIKGTFLFCDYAYSLSNKETGSRAAARSAYIDYETITQQLSAIFSNLPTPGQGDFLGASISSPEWGNFYTLDTIPAFTQASGVRYDDTSNATNSRHWRMTQGVQYDGLNCDYQFFFSPIQYPHSLYDVGGDFYCILNGMTYDEHNFILHDTPMFMSPIMNLPRADYVNKQAPIKRSPDDHTVSGFGSQHLYPHRRAMTFTPGTFNHGYSNSFWQNNGIFKPDIATAIAPCILRPYGMDYESRVSESVDVTSIPFNIGDHEGLRFNDTPVIQPGYTKNTKYTVNVSPQIASHDFIVTTNAGDCSGRYKYCGFKGTVSFFEMPAP